MTVRYALCILNTADRNFFMSSPPIRNFVLFKCFWFFQLRQDFGDTQSEHGDIKERKDSNCSVASDFGGHLYIGGRTSRLSSVGSAASGNSVASGASHLSGQFEPRTLKAILNRRVRQ